ncbi:MAG: transposase [Candidatus Njordarchaeota archaeon]
MQFLIEYKAMWIGVPVSYIDPRHTSRLCPICGFLMTGSSQREVVCRRCGVVFDRDFAASINIALRDVACGVRAEAPMSWVPMWSASADGCPREGKICAMRGRYSSSNITKFGNTYPK